MKSTRIPNEMETRAAEALNAVLHQVSSIKTNGIKFQPTHRKSDILADINVLGRKHKLVCNVADGEPEDVRKALDKLKTCADRKKDGATPVLIAPYLSPQTREMCDKNRVGFIDLQGNARLVVDEIFIGKRSAKTVPVPHAQHRMTA
jgi:hypothetical protein